jgi:hypothetical protein
MDIKKLNRTGAIVIAWIMAAVLTATAAPIRPVGPVDIIGLVREAAWVPEQKIKGRPGMSGSAGKDRINPAHFLVTLIDYQGVGPETALLMTRYLDWNALKDLNLPQKPPFILLKINSNDRKQLRPGMKIQVKGYTVRGDEGGTWTGFDSLQILPR